MRMTALVAAAALALWSGAALAQSSDDADGRSGFAIGGAGTAPGTDVCRNSSAPFDCAVARSKIDQAVSAGGEISIRIKRRDQGTAAGP
jgi:hypothetical protein